MTILKPGKASQGGAYGRTGATPSAAALDCPDSGDFPAIFTIQRATVSICAALIGRPAKTSLADPLYLDLLVPCDRSRTESADTAVPEANTPINLPSIAVSTHSTMIASISSTRYSPAGSSGRRPCRSRWPTPSRITVRMVRVFGDSTPVKNATVGNGQNHDRADLAPCQGRAPTAQAIGNTSTRPEQLGPYFDQGFCRSTATKPSGTFAPTVSPAILS